MSERPLPASQELMADRYHTGVRLATLGIWIVSVVGVYLVVAALWTAVTGGETLGVGILIVLVVALFGAQPLAAWGEKQLVGRWPSGRAVVLEPTRVTMREKTGLEHFDFGLKINYWRWRFEIRNRRGGRVPTGHFCFAIRLVQSETSTILYTFLSPAQAKELEARYPFYDLRPYATEAGKSPLGGRDAVYIAAEHERWTEGAELDAADFEKLLAHLAQPLPDFATIPNS